MISKKQMSETLRIDLIPDTSRASHQAPPPDPMPAKKKDGKQHPKWKSKKAQEPPAVSRTRYQELLQSIYDAAIVTNVYGKITDANARAMEFLQYEREELCSLQIFNVVSGAERGLIETLCEALKKQRFTLIQAYCKRKDGSYFPVEIAVNMLKFGQVYLCFFIRDITRRKQIEDRLRTEHEAVHHAAVGIVIADMDATVEYANPFFGTLIGIEDAEELVGKDLRDFLEVTDLIDTIKDKIAGEDGIVRGSTGINRVGGGTLITDYCATCSYNEDDVETNLVFSFSKSIESADATAASDEIKTLMEENQKLRQKIESYRIDAGLDASEMLDA